MSKPSNVIFADSAGDASSWQLPMVDGPSVRRRDRTTVGDLERIEQAAWTESYAKGLEAGTAAGKAEWQARVSEAERRSEEAAKRTAQLDATLRLLARPLAELDAQVEQELVTLALTVAKHLVRRELRLDPAQVIAVIRETVSLLPGAARDVRVHLHPEDAALVRERLAMPQSERAWTLVEDPVQSRGGCRVTTDTAQIDARLEARVAAVVSSLLGDERVDAGREAGQ